MSDYDALCRRLMMLHNAGAGAFPIYREAATRIEGLEAALRDIEAAWDDDAIPTEDVGARMVLIARAALTREAGR